MSAIASLPPGLSTRRASAMAFRRSSFDRMLVPRAPMSLGRTRRSHMTRTASPAVGKKPGDGAPLPFLRVGDLLVWRDRAAVGEFRSIGHDRHGEEEPGAVAHRVLL